MARMALRSINRGRHIVVGNTQSPNYPTASAIQPTYHGGCEDIYSNCVDGFVTKLNANGSAPVFSTYVGGASRATTPGGSGETIFDVAIDSAGNIYVAGMTGSTDFPTVDAFQANHAGNGDAFVTKIDSAGSAFVYSSYLGGPSDEGGYAIGIDSAGNAYVAGAATASGFPTAGAFQSAYGGGTTDGFITKISGGGATPAPAPSVSFISPNQGPTSGGTSVTIQGSGFLSGASVLFGGVSATNVVVTSGTTITANAPARAAGPVEVKIINPDGQQAGLESGYTYVQQSPSPNQPPQVSVTASPASGMAPLAVSFTSSATDPDGQIVAYNWDFGDGQTSNQPAASHTYQSAGFYMARLTVTDNSGASSSASVNISVAEAQQVAGDVVLYAVEARARVGLWSLVSDATAAGGARMFFRDAGALPPKSALPSPNNYVELTFNAEAGIGYRLWVRGKAQNDSAANDSVFIQFSDSLNSAGFAVLPHRNVKLDDGQP